MRMRMTAKANQAEQMKNITGAEKFSICNKHMNDREIQASQLPWLLRGEFDAIVH